MGNSIFKTERMPDSWLEAILIVLSKENTDPLDVASYRPIALLNIDVIFFTKVLTNHLTEINADYIIPDQVLFPSKTYLITSLELWILSNMGKS